MTIEEAMEVFEKHPQDWSFEERCEFVKALEIKDMRNPHNLTLACNPIFHQFLSREVMEWIFKIVNGDK